MLLVRHAVCDSVVVVVVVCGSDRQALGLGTGFVVVSGNGGKGGPTFAAATIPAGMGIPLGGGVACLLLRLL